MILLEVQQRAWSFEQHAGRAVRAPFGSAQERTISCAKWADAISRPSLALLGAEPFRAAMEHVVELLAGHTQRATLIGWGPGGIYAREIGKLIPRRVRQVITIGTPFNAETDHTNVGWLFRVLSGS